MNNFGSFVVLTKLKPNNRIVMGAMKLPLPHPPVSLGVSISDVVKVLEGGMNMKKEFLNIGKTIVKAIVSVISLEIKVIDIPLMPRLIT